MAHAFDVEVQEGRGSVSSWGKLGYLTVGRSNWNTFTACCMTIVSAIAGFNKSVYSMTLPTILFIGACSVYWHVNETEQPGNLPVCEFFSNVIIQLIPLVLIKYKIAVFDDALSAICRFSQKVMLMHFALFLTRVITFPYISFVGQDWSFFLANAVSLVGAFLALHFGFNFKWRHICSQENGDLQLILVAASIIGCVQQYRYGITWNVSDVLTSIWNAMEVMTFAPALFLLYQMDQRAELFTPLPEKSSRTQAVSFFVFIVSFYIHENVMTPMRMAQQGLSKLRNFSFFCGGHLMHLVMLLDFGAFFLFQAWFPTHLKVDQGRGEKEKGETKVASEGGQKEIELEL